MYQLIFTGDNIDQGRVKINERLFTGFTASDKWVFLNSGTTGFSLEISAATSIATQNFDYSTIGNNIIVGHNNYVEYDDVAIMVYLKNYNKMNV